MEQHIKKVGSNGAQTEANLLVIQDLVKTYPTPSGDFFALKGVNMTASRGEFLAVIGKSGAGKSTLINMITGIDRPTGGAILVDDTPIHALNEDQRARWRGLNMGIIFQFFQLLPNLSLIENITLAMDFRNTYPLKERKERALYLLEQVGIAEHAYKPPSKISGGQQQRVAIARALANNPPLIVADEPTGNLDSHTADDIFRLLARLVEEEGKTVVMVTHDKEIDQYASRVIEITDGEILNN